MESLEARLGIVREKLRSMQYNSELTKGKAPTVIVRLVENQASLQGSISSTASPGTINPHIFGGPNGTSKAVRHNKFLAIESM